ncbi:MAG: hypothetical protein IT428_25545 [Planctomycetaceae bacterium]|nr:hypothetical protein [Planctomycetaceae bacterium]
MRDKMRWYELLLRLFAIVAMLFFAIVLPLFLWTVSPIWMKAIIGAVLVPAFGYAGIQHVRALSIRCSGASTEQLPAIARYDRLPKAGHGAILALFGMCLIVLEAWEAIVTGNVAEMLFGLACGTVFVLIGVSGFCWSMEERR